ncbi:MAG: hypothetical protein P8018_04035, partial [Acidobacteriota bacterium]
AKGVLSAMEGGVIGGISNVAMGGDFWKGFTEGVESAGLSFVAGKLAIAIKEASVHDPTTEQVTEKPEAGKMFKKTLTRTTTISGKYAKSVTTTKLSVYVDSTGHLMGFKQGETSISTVTYDGHSTEESLKEIGHMPANVAKSLANMPVDSVPRDVTKVDISSMNLAEQRAAKVSYASANLSLSVASFKAAATASGEMNQLLYAYQNGRIPISGGTTSPVPAFLGSVAAGGTIYGLLRLMPEIHQEQLHFTLTGELPH